MTAYVYASARALTNPADGAHGHFKDHWWQYVPDKGFVFVAVSGDAWAEQYVYPQCNRDRGIVERLSKHRDAPEGVEIVFLPSAFVPCNHEKRFTPPPEPDAGSADR